MMSSIPSRGPLPLSMVALVEGSTLGIVVGAVVARVVSVVAAVGVVVGTVVFLLGS